MRSDKREGFVSRRRRGWGMGLYRNRSQGWIGGVCSGLADHWGLPFWMTRLAAVALLIFTGSLAFWSYVAAWMLLAPQPTRWDAAEIKGRHDEDVEMEYDKTFVNTVHAQYFVIQMRPLSACVKPKSDLMVRCGVWRRWSAM